MSVQTGRKDDEMEEEIIEVGSFGMVVADKIPDPPSKIMKSNQEDQTWSYLGSFTEAMWAHTDGYLYRNWPIINRKPFNIGRFPTTECPTFNRDWLLKNFGSGDYKILVTDTNKTIKGKGGKFFEAFFSLRDNDYPPVVVIEELDVDHRDNRTYVDKLRAEGKLDSDGRVKMNQPIAAGNDPALMALVTTLVRQITEAKNQVVSKDPAAEAISSIFMKTHEQSMQLLKDQVKSDDPDKLVKMLGALKEMLPKAESGNSMLEVVVKMNENMAKIQADASKGREDLLMKMMEIVGTKKEEGGIKEQLEVFQMMKEVMGGGEGGANRTPKWWEVAIEQGAPIVGKAFDMMLAVMSIKNYEKGLKMQPGGQTNPGATSPVVVQQPQQVESGKVVEMPRQEMGEKQVSQFGMMLRQYGGLILNAINKEQSGDDFADALVGMVGKPTYVQIVQMGKDGMLAEMKAVPEFWEKLAPIEPMVVQFVEEFIEYGNEKEEGGE